MSVEHLNGDDPDPIGSAALSTNVLVTGATGFVGRALVKALTEAGVPVRVAVRSAGAGPQGLPAVAAVPVGDIGPQTDWRSALAGIDVVVHLAARVHVMREASTDPLEAFRRVNTHGTVRLAEQCLQAGVQRLVYVSTIKVNGEATHGLPFTADDRPHPMDHYGRSKHEAEQSLWQIQRAHGLQIVAVRPPLVYGPGVKGNFSRLLGWVERGVPLPFASVDNRRTLLGLTNLVDLLMTCMDHPAAAGRVFLAGDGESVSTPELMRRIGRALGKPVRLFPAPTSWLHAAFRMCGMAAVCERLCGSLEVDATATQRLLGWQPRTSLDAELHRAAVSYRATRSFGRTP